MSQSTIVRRRSVLLAATAAVACAAGPAFAGAFALREQSTVGQGMSFAGMAAGGGDSISGMFWNPAVVNQVVHFQGEQHVSGVFPTSDVDVSQSTKDTIGRFTGGLGETGNGGNIGQGALLAAGYNAYRLTDRIAVGLSVNTPFGLVTDPRNNWAGQYLARSSKVLSVNATPTVGYIVNDWLSVGVGVQVQYFDIKLRQATPVPGGLPGAALPFLPGAASTKLSGDDIGFGFTAGAILKPVEGTEIGVGYRSRVSHNLKGKLRAEIPPAAGGGVATQRIKADIGLPDSATIGLRQRVTDQFTFLAGFEWTNWSKFKSFDVKARNGGGLVTELPFNYNDGYFASIGGEYAYNEELTLRAGVAYEWSPINNKNRTVRLPDDDRWWLSAGASYAYSDRLGFDLGYSYVFVPGKSKINEEFPAGIPVVIPGVADGFNAKSESDVHIVSAAVRYKFGGDAAPALVTKY
ncbi:OmpP1/FadL family transporter [Methylopila henanensis]|uniref:OmpP1/FadL family transporter n=1 Tax=Methylopila henanensis TaxID=873516 RepID=A0ABW4K2Q2_9HYPH